MTKKLLKQLVEYSYTNRCLDNKRVLAVADRLDRKDLKQYIKALKRIEKSRNVYVTTTFRQSDLLKQEFKDLYPGKKVIINTDPSLILGIKITDNDDITEINLNHQLDDIMGYIENG
jgi:hypothetical protein